MQPFSVHISPSILRNLTKRIRATRWPDQIKDSGWQYGVPISYMQDLCNHWATQYDWKRVENKINSYPNFIFNIDGYQIHCLHARGKGDSTVPIIITHGWPGSFLEIVNSIPFLTAPGEISFDVVVPSLPGYGFSGKPDKEGMNTALIAQLWVKLMEELGYRKFFAQGGDFGADVSTHLALRYSDYLLGLHLHYIPFSYKPYLKTDERLTEEECAAQQKTVAFFQSAGAYAQQHISSPLTLSYGLNDSPVGLAAWILQIFKSFSDPGKSLSDLFDRDDLLDNITLYWVTETIHSSIRLYRETLKKPLAFTSDDYINVPVGIAHYPFPDSFPAKKYVERGYNIQYWKEMSIGGHFAAMEQPKIFSEDVREFAAMVSMAH
jgi:pimeloyl-ACP methyl ester carboxylesterase